MTPLRRTTTPLRRAAALALAAGLLLAGCTGSGDDAADDATTAGQAAGDDAGTTGSGTTGPGTANAADQVMAEQTSAAPGDVGGELTLTLRAVEVGGGNMTVRWALRWDNDDAAADATVRYIDMGLGGATLVTDRSGLKAYRPYCTDGSWQAPEGATATEAGIAAIRCGGSMLVSPLDTGGSFYFPNHGAIESWAILPAPEGNPATVDVAPVEGLPLFTDATVTYLDGGAE